MGKETNQPTDKKTGKEWTAPIWAAVITGIVTLLVALLNFPPFSKLFEPIPTVTFMPTSTIATDTPISEPTSTPTFILNPTETLPPTSSVTPIPSSATLTPTGGLSTGMQVKITANQLRGHAPLSVTLNAKDSFVRAPDGNIFECRRGGCSYIWYVYLNGEQFIEPQKTNGTLELRLEKRGNYFVSVYICHGADTPTCASGGTVVIVE
ncbi:MAG: hypothetical protein DCC56_00325 [Anaerolineae bacterium]|nr:MAG: hypothetical protein DCC56_00325 [Anaerolineae bacterium]WKZ44478.1 MAG: hypothetical protein QY302_01645 [Anaerolineales bacterium]